MSGEMMQTGEDKTELTIGVRQLVEHVMRCGDLNLTFQLASGTVEGIRAHQRIQKSRPAHYTPELSVAFRKETADVVLTVSGRMDGLYQPETEDGVVMVDEIKTTNRDLEAYRDQENPLHRGQAMVYAYIHAAQNKLSMADTQLTYYHLGSGKKLELIRRHSFEELEDYFNGLVRAYLAWAKVIAEWYRIRDRSAASMVFPFDEYRKNQRSMAVAVYRAARDGEQLLVQAPTGIGKTLAVLFPAVKSLGEGTIAKIFYLTARTTGRTAAEKALAEIRRSELRLKSLTLTAKDKICFSPGSACTPDDCSFARGHYDRVKAALEDIFTQDAFTREVVIQKAEQHKVCPFEFSLDLSLWCDCIICDYNYVFDPRVYLRRFFMESSEPYLFLVDEAHNLVDRSRDMFSAEIRKQPFLDARRAVGKSRPRIYRQMGKINSYLVGTRKTCDLAGGAYSETEEPEGLFPLLADFVGMTGDWLALNQKESYREQLLELYFSVNTFLRVAQQFDTSYATCYEKSGQDLRVRLFCLDPAAQMAEALKRCRSAVFFSATMAPVEYFKKLLGCQESSRVYLFDSPFPPENLGLFLLSSVSTLYRQRESSKSEVCEAIHLTASLKKGNYLFFFPSYQYMDMVYAEYNPGEVGIRAIIQEPGMTEGQREAFLDQFSEENRESLAGFVVMGGIFGEGIDLAGERLSGAVVVGVGLPGISAERELIRAYFDAAEQAGFEYAYMYPGINRVCQAAGRVIRTETDRGVVLLVDRRFATARYRSLLPPWWRPAVVVNMVELGVKLRRFWAE